MECESTPMLAHCRGGCGLYGSPAINGFCYLCYEENLETTQQPPVLATPGSSSQHSSSNAGMLLSTFALPTMPTISLDLTSLKDSTPTLNSFENVIRDMVVKHSNELLSRIANNKKSSLAFVQLHNQRFAIIRNLNKIMDLTKNNNENGLSGLRSELTGILCNIDKFIEDYDNSCINKCGNLFEDKGVNFRFGLCITEALKDLNQGSNILNPELIEFHLKVCKVQLWNIQIQKEIGVLSKEDLKKAERLLLDLIQNYEKKTKL